MADTGKIITLRQILNDIDAAVAVMSTTNPHRRLFLQCRQALMELARRVPPPEPIQDEVSVQ